MVQLTQNHPYVTLRVKFKKVGALQYVSHLDLVRTMHKIVTRAALPLWYTEGFNPKPKLIFAAPLSVGIESVTEYVDIKLVDDIPPEEAMRRLNANMTDEMQVLEAYYTETKPTTLKWLSYKITVHTDGADEAVAERCNALFASDVIEVAKKGKLGDEPKLVNIKPQIKSAAARYDGEMDAIVVDALLSSDSSAFLNPEYLVKAMRSYVGILKNPDITSEFWSIMRLEAFTEDMTPFR